VHSNPVVVIAGPTGSGKTRLSLALASSLGGEIVNYDSVQVYRGFDIGSAKPSVAERDVVPHHLIDFVEATTEYTAADFQKDADRVIAAIEQRGRIPIFAGGTFFYLRAVLAGLPALPQRDAALRGRLDHIASRNRGRDRLRRMLENVDPISAARIAPGDWHRTQRALEVYLLTSLPFSQTERPTADTPPRIPSIMIGLSIERTTLHERLQQRAIAMYDRGLIDETRQLLSRYPASAKPFDSIGYREAVRHLAGELSLEEAIAETARRTRAYAKRQITWLRGERNVQWIDAGTELADQLQAIHDILNRRMIQ
jgi:tRNA dimethylallyltransferase